MPNPSPRYNTQPVSENELAVWSLKNKHEAGAIGKIIGTNPLNFASMVALILLLAAIMFTVWPSKDFPPMDFWKIVMPFLSVVVGYVFGRDRRNPR